jgi:adenylate cyclase
MQKPPNHLSYESDGDARRMITALAALYAGPSNRYLNLYGPPGTIRTIPYHALVGNDGQNEASSSLDLSGKVVFIGYSDLYEPDQPDRFYTVFTGSDGTDLSGVEIMATAFANLLRDDALRQSGPAFSAVLLFGFGCALGAGVYPLPAMLALPFVGAFSALYAAGAVGV